MFTWASFENRWIKLLREFAKRRQKETQILTTHKIFIKMHIVQLKKQQIRHIINKHVKKLITRKRMVPLNDENKLQVDKNKKRTEKLKKTELKYQKL